MFFEKQIFVLNNVLCGKTTGNGTAQVMFRGNSFKITVDGAIDGLSVNGTIPFWGKGEMVRVAVFFEGKFENKKSKNMHFVPGSQQDTENVELEAIVVASSESVGGVLLQFDSYWSTKYGPQIVVTAKVFVVQLPNNGTRGPFFLGTGSSRGYMDFNRKRWLGRNRHCCTRGSCVCSTGCISKCYTTLPCEKYIFRRV